MLVLKLRRTGKKHQPSYRLVVNERRSKLNGRNVDNLGWYDPKSKRYQLNKDRVLHWLSHGAQKTDTVNNLLIRAGIITSNKISVHKKSKQVDQKKDSKNMEEQLANQMPTEGQPESQPEMPAAPETPVAPEAPAEEEKPAEMPMGEPEAPAAPNVEENQPGL